MKFMDANDDRLAELANRERHADERDKLAAERAIAADRRDAVADQREIELEERAHRGGDAQRLGRPAGMGRQRP